MGAFRQRAEQPVVLTEPERGMRARGGFDIGPGHEHANPVGSERRGLGYGRRFEGIQVYAGFSRGGVRNQRRPGRAAERGAREHDDGESQARASMQ